MLIHADIFATVNAVEPWISMVVAVACVGALAALPAKSSLSSAAVVFVMVAVSFAIEAVFRRLTGRGLRA